MTPPPAAGALWRTLKRIDKSKINRWIAVRNSLAVAIPLSIGIAVHKPLGGVAVATGALNVAYSDGRDPYAQRARRMLCWSLLGAVAVFLGSSTGEISWLAVLVVTVWAFLAGLLASVSTRVGDLGLNTLVALIVYGARGALSVEGAAIAGLLVLSGGLLQTLLALAFWPVRRYAPERRALAEVYRKLSNEIDPHTAEELSTPLNLPVQQVQDAIAALGTDHSVEGERYRVLFDQADRVRLSVFVVERLRSELEDRRRVSNGRDRRITNLETLLSATARLLEAVSNCLASASCGDETSGPMEDVQLAVKAAHTQEESSQDSLSNDLLSAVETLAGQLRLVKALAAGTTDQGNQEFDKRQRSYSWRLQLSSWIGTLRAHLTPRSVFFRHAIRLAACVALGDGIGRMISWQRSYWIPMTIAVVLKPDFTTTMSRGVLRLAGTFSGLLLATVLYHLIPPSALSELLLVGAFTLLLRSLGPANYGIFSVAISGLIVFLIAETGIAPAQVIGERAANTVAGGLFALAAYAIWPTWERRHVSDAMADMIEASRRYFRAVADRFGDERPMAESDLDDYRAEWRRTRSGAEASVDRVASEPRTTPLELESLTSMLASSHALMLTVMGLEAVVIQGNARTAAEGLSVELPATVPREDLAASVKSTEPPLSSDAEAGGLRAFMKFAHDVDLTLYFVVSALRGSSGALTVLPKLRDDHTRMVEARQEFSALDELALLETDRLTSTLNTLREQAMRYVGETGSRPSESDA